MTAKDKDASERTLKLLYAYRTYLLCGRDVILKNLKSEEYRAYSECEAMIAYIEDKLKPKEEPPKRQDTILLKTGQYAFGFANRRRRG
jgi:hypothetical protein